MDEKRSFLDTTEAEWKKRFGEFETPRKTFVFGYWLGRRKVKVGDPHAEDEIESLDPYVIRSHEFADIVWKLRARALDEQRETERNISIYNKGPRHFKGCPKCRNVVGTYDAIYVATSDPTYGQACQAVSSWPHPPDVALSDMAEEGFFVRCGNCSYAWYEPMEDPNG